jgi:putative mRNA 3-end processing factor
MTLLQNTERGLYCEPGNFYVDPWQPVDTAVITHAHSDHARLGSDVYLTEASGEDVLRARLGPEARIETLRYGEAAFRDAVKVSFHPAGHILGSAQVRLDRGGETWVVSGDYKLENDGLYPAFEPVRCHTFVTESTFGLPIYHWRPQAEIFDEINEWWRENQAGRRTSVLFCYALGKAQWILKGLDPGTGPIFLHGAMERYLPAYARQGVIFPLTTKVDRQTLLEAAGRGLVLAPQSADNSPWLRKFGDISKAFASGWMQIRGTRRRGALDRGFVLSDHADWPGLQQAIQATGAERIWVTHGYTHPLARYLREAGLRAEALETRFVGELDEETEKPANESAPAPAETPAP